MADDDLSSLLVNVRGSERAARGAAVGTGWGGEAGRKRGFDGRNNNHRARGLVRGRVYRAKAEHPSTPACSEPEQHAGIIPLHCRGGGFG